MQRCVIFDLDGTIVDSHAYTFAAFRFACVPFRDPPEDAEVYAAFGPWERVILSRLLPASRVDEAYARLQTYYAEHAARLRVHAEIRPLLCDCRAAGIGLGLFTGRGADSTSLVLEALDLDRAFSAIVSGNAVLRPPDASGPGLRPKPAPDGVLHLLRSLGCAAESTIVVGDSPLDVEAARSAGAQPMFATWYPWPVHTPPDDVPRLERPDALRSWLGLAG